MLKSAGWSKFGPLLTDHLKVGHRLVLLNLLEGATVGGHEDQPLPNLLNGLLAVQLRFGGANGVMHILLFTCHPPNFYCKKSFSRNTCELVQH